MQVPEQADGAWPDLHVHCGGDEQATRFRMGPQGVVDIEVIAPDGGARLTEQIDRSLALSGAAVLRVLLMHYFVEMYLDDYLMLTYALPAISGGKSRQPVS